MFTEIVIHSNMNLKKRIEINKLLVIRLSSMGDIVLTTPVVRAIKKSLPNSKIDFLTSGQFSEIYKYNPNVDNLIEYQKTASISENSKIKNSLDKYDLIIDLQNNFRSRAFSSGLADNILRVKKNRLHKLSLVYLKKSIIKNYSVVQNYFDALSSLNIQADELGNEVFLKDGLSSAEKRRNDSSGLTFGFAPGANHFTKRYPSKKFADLAKSLIENYNAGITLFGGKQDIQICKEINQLTGNKLKDLSGSDSILETVKNLKEIDLLITNDTGVMHLASACNIPIIAIFGSSVRELGFLPYRIKYELAEADLKCRPCSHIGRSSCPKKHFECMNSINPSEILLAVKKILGK